MKLLRFIMGSRDAQNSTEADETILECGDLSPLSAGDLSPSSAPAPPSRPRRAVERGTASPTSWRIVKGCDKSQHSKADAGRAFQSFARISDQSFPLQLCALLALLGALSATAQTNDSFTRTRDVTYAQRLGQPLTFDVFTPTNAHGAGILWLVSAGYGSSPAAIQPKYFRALLARGYTVFAVTHLSAPRCRVPDIEPDILRAARFIRNDAARYGVAPDRLGAIGTSAGGHLALTLATKGAPGDPQATNAIERASSAVQCAVAFFPPTDYLNYGRPGREAEWIKPLLGADATNNAPETTRRLRQISVLHFIRSNQPPALLFQGDKDYLVPVEQARSFVRRYTEAGNTAKLIIKPGAGHGWPDMAADMETAADWFDEHLRAAESKPGSHR